MVKKNFESADYIKFFNYAWPVVGTASITTTTSVSVALATIESTDIVLANTITAATASYVTKVKVTAGTGFVIYASAAPGANGTIGYAVFKQNS